MAALKIAAPFPIFPTTSSPPSRHPGATTEVRFSRWNNANAQPFIRRQRDQQEIEDDIRRHRRHHSAARIANDPAAPPPPSSAPEFKSHGTPSSPSPPSIPGKSSKYSKPPRKPKPPSHPAFRRIPRAPVPARLSPEPGEAGISLGEHGIAYRIKGAPFEFQYSYTETPKVKPLALREPPFLPFGPTTMPRPWTGRPPLPPSKKKLPEFDSFKLPPPGKKGVKPVQSPGPFVAGSGPKYTMSREEILGEPLTEEEVKELVKGNLRSKRMLHMGRDGLTHNMLDNIHNHWKRRRVCKIKCIGVCTVDMDNVRQQLEEKTGGKVIYNRGGVIFLFRGRNYNYRSCPRFPLMLWKPVTPVYPRLLQRVPEGLTPKEATEMRNKGHKLPSICKLGKNGLYSNLVQNVREAFEECELVRINCKGLDKSDFKKIGAKLKDLVPCVLLSFSYEHILIWRGKDWKSTLPPLEDNHNGAVELVADGLSTTLCRTTDSLLDSQEILESDAGTCSNKLNLDIPIENISMVEHVDVGETEDPSSLEIMDQSSTFPSTDPTKMTVNADDSSIIVSRQSLFVIREETPTSPSERRSEEDPSFVIPCQSISLNKGPNIEESKDLSHTESALQLLPASSVDLTWMESNEAITRTGEIDSSDGLEMIPIDSSQCESDMKNSACLDGVMLLLRQAVETGSAVVLDDESLDANLVYEKSVALAKTAPPGPVFLHRIRKVAVQKTNKEKSKKFEEQDLEVEVVTASEKKGNERKNYRSRKRDDFKVVPSDVVPHGSLRVDELAKLLA